MLLGEAMLVGKALLPVPSCHSCPCLQVRQPPARETPAKTFPQGAATKQLPIELSAQHGACK